LPYDKTKDSIFGASNEREGEGEGGRGVYVWERGRERRREKGRRGEKMTKKLKTVEKVK
jgi:hypothetical protein